MRIGTSKRDSRTDGRDMPGPGNYNVSKHLGGTGYAFGSGSRSNLKSDATPGPGHYK